MTVRAIVHDDETYLHGTDVISLLLANQMQQKKVGSPIVADFMGQLAAHLTERLVDAEMLKDCEEKL
jgi:prophage antirepressor-like protein